MTTPHKHEALIIAWARGAEIEFYNVRAGRWGGTINPQWAPANIYRIKEVPKPPVKFNVYRCHTSLYTYEAGLSNDLAAQRHDDYVLIPSLCYEEPAK